MSVSTLSRRALGAVAAASLLVGLVPATASAATPAPRDISKFACPAGEVPDPNFSDDGDTIHEASIACVVWYEIASGRTATTYAPKADVNRAQMASFIGNLLEEAGVALPQDPPNAFPDDDASPHHLRINQLAALGVVGGFEDGEYKPGLPVIRAQMATFINNSYEEITGSRLTSSQNYFTDDDGNIHEGNINAVAGAGIAAGTSADSYEPGEPVKRDQMATFLSRETDLLVEQGEMTKPVVKPADVKLTATTVEQGGTLTGSIDTQAGVEITAARVSGCGFTDEPLTLVGDANAFELGIRVTQPVGDCTLTFTIERAEGDDVTDEETIAVTARQGATAGPELLKAEKVATSSDGTTVTVRYTFDEALRELAPGAPAFRLYDADAVQSEASSARHAGAGIVDAVFTADAFNAATTATVAADAVEDGQSIGNPEGAVALVLASRTLSSTEAPDLVQVSNSPAGGTAWLFLFDEVVAAHPGTAADYHLVLDDGTVLDGDALTDATGDEQVQVTFEAIPEGRTVARGYVETDTVAGPGDDGNPLNGVEDGNPTHAEEVKSGGDTPYLIKVAIDAANDTVTYTFNRGVRVLSRSLAQGSGFIAYDADGDEIGTNDATASGSQVVARFSGTDPITTATVGASVRADAVEATSGTQKPNEVDEQLPDTAPTVDGARGGETAAPDLRSARRSIDGNDSVLVLEFDAPVSRVTPESPTETLGDVVIYQQDGTRTELDLNDASGNECTTQDNTVVCRAASTSTLGQLIDSAVLGAVEHNTVASSSSPTAPRNYEASAPIQ